MRNVTEQAPGKLFIAGEYAIVESGQTAILTTVSRYLSVSLRETEEKEAHLHSAQHPDLYVTWTRKDQHFFCKTEHPYAIVERTIQKTEEFLQLHGVSTTSLFHISIQSQLDDEQSKKKYGLGSSGAVTVALIRALCSFYQYPISHLEVFKLASIIHWTLGSKGSFGDLAAASYTGWIAYTNFDRSWFQQQMSHPQTIKELIQQDWPLLRIQALKLPSSLLFLAGWTQSVALTESSVKKVHDQLDDPVQTAYYTKFLDTNRSNMQQLVTAFHTNDTPLFLHIIRSQRHLLVDFARQFHFAWETDALTTLCSIAEQYEGTAKPSGAGGGDCGICFVTHSSAKEAILQEWRHHTIIPLDTE